MTNYKLEVAYVGTAYKGWQVQPGFPTVQGAIQELLAKIFSTPVNLSYSSRTDTGVHALSNVANFIVDSDYSAEALFMMLNTQLPKDIVVIGVNKVPLEFNARHAIKKTYFYRVYNGQVKDPFRLNRALWLPYKLNKNNMIKGLSILEGKKDFKSFMASGSDIKSTIREIYMATLIEHEDELRFYFTADGFLKQMVRNMVGTIIELGRGRFSVEDIDRIIRAKDRTKAGPTAPAYGLYLKQVYYE